MGSFAATVGLGTSLCHPRAREIRVVRSLRE
jgi:hypothetical protein